MFTYLANLLGSFDPYDGLYLITAILLILLAGVTYYQKKHYVLDKPPFGYTIINSFLVITLLTLLVIAQGGKKTILKPNYTVTTRKIGNWQNIYEKDKEDVFAETAGNKKANTIALKSYSNQQSNALTVPIAKQTQTILFTKGNAKKEVTFINPIIERQYKTTDRKNAIHIIDHIDMADETVKVTSNGLTQLTTAKTAKMHITVVDKSKEPKRPQSDYSTTKNQDMLNRLIAGGNPFYTVQ